VTGQEKMILNIEQLRNHKLLKEDAGVQEFLKEDPFPLLNTEFSPDGRFVAFLFELPDSNMLVVKDTVLDDFTGFLVRDVGHYFVFDDLNGLYFVKLNLDTKKGQKVFRADLTPPKSQEEAILEDARQRIAKKPVLRVDLVYEEKDYNFSVDISSTLSRQYILITSDNKSDDRRIRANEMRFRASNRSDGDWILLREREEGVFYDAKQLEEYLYIMFTSLSEPNSKILRTKIPSTYRYNPVPAETSDRTDVTTDFLGAEIYIPYSETVSMISFESFKNYIVIIQSDTETSLEYIKLINLRNSTTAVVSYQDYEGQLKIANNKSYRIHQIPTEYSYDSDSFVYRLSTLNSPDKMINYNMNTRQNTVLRPDYHMPDVRLEDYTSERIVLSANDGERIPVTLIYNKNLVRQNKDNYVVLQSYGGDRENTHNFTLNPHWISMLDRGFLWAIPHVRGSADVTTQWFLKGSGQNKTRHLQDFLDVAVSLASEKIASHLCAYSDNPSGGLTIASVILKEPQIFESAAIRNPITDVFQYLNNKRQMIEFGDMQDKAVYEVIKSYSPYHQPVPSSDLTKLMISADFDHECAFHAIRLTAKLREVSAKHGNLIVYHEFPTWVPDPMKRAEEFGFIMSHSMLESRDR
jgi:oligopeptidase B